MTDELTDGILCMAEWERASVKVLHLLKQPSEEHKETFAAQVKDQVGRPKLHRWWEEVALRSAAVLHPTETRTK